LRARVRAGARVGARAGVRAGARAGGRASARAVDRAARADGHAPVVTHRPAREVAHASVDVTGSPGNHAHPMAARRHATCDDTSGMPTRLVIGSVVVLAACGNAPHDDHATGDGGAVLTDGSNLDGGIDPL